jgi:putative flippase GtrA
VGGFAALLHWLARLTLSLWFSFSTALVLAYAIGMLTAFILNSYFVFPKSMKPKKIQARDFAVINFSFFPVVWLASVQINNWLKSLGFISHTEGVAHALAIPIPILASFLIYKFFAFKEN